MKNHEKPLFEIDLSDIHFDIDLRDISLQTQPRHHIKPQEHNIAGDHVPPDAFMPAPWNTRYMPSEYAPRKYT